MRRAIVTSVSALAITLWTATASAIPVTTGLVSYWEAEGNALDSAGSNDGTLVNGAGYGTGQNGIGQAFVFDGVNDYVNAGSDSSLVMNSAFTVSSWIRPTSAGTGGTAGGIIINKEGEYEVSRFADGSIRWAVANSSPGWFWINTGLNAALNQWLHVTIVYDSVAGTMTTYGNGVFAHSAGVSGAVGDVNPGLNQFWIGGRSALSQFFGGSIDNVALWSRALTAEEVRLVATDSSGRVPAPGLLALFGVGLAGLGWSRRKRT